MGRTHFLPTSVKIVVAVGAALVLWGLVLALTSSPARAAGSCSTTAGTTTCTFSSTGAEDTFVVPEGVSSVHVVATGARGSGSFPGHGARVSGDLAVTPGKTLYVEVGGFAHGGFPSCDLGNDCIGGFNGGGSSGIAGSGGGASDVRTVSRNQSGSLGSRLLVAAGGGGGGGFARCKVDNELLPGGSGGDAGSDGGDGPTCGSTAGGTGGKAGGQSAGGAGGSPRGGSGSLGQGGGSSEGGGGGGGYYGGGGGGDRTHDPGSNSGVPSGGGGGGSNLVPTGGTATITSASPSIIISYTEPNQAPVNTVPGDQSTNEDTALTFNSANSNLISISDVDAGTSPVKVTLAVSHGKLTLEGDTSGLTFAAGSSNGTSNMTFTGTIASINSALSGLKFDPDANYNGPAALSITTDDQGNTGTGGAKSDTDTVNITVNSVNDAPVAANDGYSTDEDTPLSVTAANGVLANDSDVEGSSLSAVLVDGPAHVSSTSSFSLNPNGSFSYTPEANYHGSDSFTYKATDGTAESNTATVNITVKPLNDTPQAADDTTTYTMAEDANAITIDFGALVSDVETSNADLTYNITAPPEAQGSVSGTGSTRTFDSADNFNGTVDIFYTVTDRGDPDNCSASPCDAPKSSAQKKVTVTVSPVNDTPVANDDSTTWSMNEDAAAISVDLRTLVSDVETNDDHLTYTIVSGPDAAKGTLSSTATNGVYSFDSADNFNGPASFTYKVKDRGDPDDCGPLGSSCTAAKDSATKTVTIDVSSANDAPTVAVAAGGSCGTNDRSGTINLTVNDPDGLAGLTFKTDSSNKTLVPASGLALSGSGASRTLTATAASGKTGTATITVTVSDGTDTGTVALTLKAGGNSNDTLTGTNAMATLSGTDILLGQNGDDVLNGSGANDLLCGGRGNDTLNGDAGDDTMSGGLGADLFSGGTGTDTVKDFTPSQGDTKDNTIP